MGIAYGTGEIVHALRLDERDAHIVPPDGGRFVEPWKRYSPFLGRKRVRVVRVESTGAPAGENSRTQDESSKKSPDKGKEPPRDWTGR